MNKNDLSEKQSVCDEGRIQISPSYMIYCLCWSVFTALYRVILILAMPMVLDAILAGVAIPADNFIIGNFIVIFID